jgi:hypothetical protein
MYKQIHIINRPIGSRHTPRGIGRRTPIVKALSRLCGVFGPKDVFGERVKDGKVKWRTGFRVYLKHFERGRKLLARRRQRQEAHEFKFGKTA